MKTNQALMLLAIPILLIGCATPDHSHLYSLSSNKGWEATVTPAEVHSYIPWEEAVDLIMNGRVVQVAQRHSLEVGLELSDGSYWSTIQPDIDTVFILVNRCGRPCRNTMLLTE